MNRTFWKTPLSDRAVALIVWTLYLAAAGSLLAHHEIWRDEARALGVIQESRTPGDVVRGLKNEGHPLLWHFILFAGWKIFHSPLVLPLSNLAIASAAAYYFLRRAPFSWPVRIAFVFGYFPLVEYGIIARNYSMGLLALCLSADAWRQRFTRPALYGAALFFLANTHANCLIFAIALVSAWAFEGTFSKEGRSASRPYAVLGGLALAGCGIALSVLQILPDRTTDMTTIYKISLWGVIPGLLDGLVIGGYAFRHAFGFESAYVSVMLVWLGYLVFWKRPGLFVAYLLGVMGMTAFFLLIYAGYLRHQGFLVMYLVALLWMDRTDREACAAEPREYAGFKNAYLHVILALQITMTGAAAVGTVRDEFSSSKKLAEFVRGRPALEGAVLLSEPDFYGEPMSYYLPESPLYLVREKRFGRKVNFTNRNGRHLSLRRLLAEGNRLRHRTGRPVIFLIGHSLFPEGPYERPYARGTRFYYSKRSLALFLKRAPLAASMKHAAWENFDVYVLGGAVS